MTEDRSRVVSQTILYAAGQSLIALRELIILPLFARLLGREAYGVFAQLTVVLGLMIPFVTFKLQASTVRYLASEDDLPVLRRGLYSGLVWVVGSCFLAGALVSLVPGPSARAILGGIEHRELIPLAALLLAVTGVVVYLHNFFRIIRRIDRLAAVLVGQTLLEIAAILLLVYRGHGIRGALWGLIGVRAAVALGILAVVWRRLGRPAFDWSRLKPLLAYSIPLMPNGVLRWLINYADRLVIIQVLGLAAVGVYAASYSLGKVLHLLVMPLGVVLFPFLSRLWDRGERAEVRRYLSHATRYYLLVAMPACVGIGLLSQPLLRLIATARFETSTALVLWIALGFVLNGVFQINVYAFHLTHRTRSLSLILGASAALNIALNILLVPTLGLTGAAIATATAFALMAVSALVCGRRLIGYSIRWLDLGKGLAGVAIMVGVIRLLPAPAGWAGIVGVAALGAAVYFACLLGLRAVSKGEAAELWRLLFASPPAVATQPGE
ncbi:MAG: oligosaccharide flippase family protein [Thermoanaerobaculia bacterium]